MNITNLVFEAQLELESLKFLKLIENPNTLDEAKKVSKVLVNQIFNEDTSIFHLKAAGNYGIALSSILYNQLFESNEEFAAITLVAYWALTNHIEHDSQPLLLQNRAITMYSGRIIFYKIYKQIIENSYNQFTPTYGIAMSTHENTINQLFMYDLFKIKDESEIANNIYKQFVNVFGLNASGYYSLKYYNDLHENLKNFIKASFK